MRSALDNNAELIYQVHIGYLGWRAPSYTASLEAMTIYPHNIQAIVISPSLFMPGLKYKTRIQGEDWSPYVSAGEVGGSVGRGADLDGIAICSECASGLRIGYRVHTRGQWSRWAYDGEELSEGEPISGIEIAIFRATEEPVSDNNAIDARLAVSYEHNDSIISLDDIGVKAGTDKNSHHHNYLSFYESFFNKFRYESFILAEVGILSGASIRMWEEYFPNVRIIAFDIHPKPNPYKNTTVIIGDASDPFFLSQVLSRYRPFIMIEDGSHKYSQQITTFEEAFLYIQPGGFYICEDVQTSFGRYRDREYNDQPLDAITYFNQISSLVVNKGNKSHPGLLDVSKRQCDIARNIDFIAFRGECVMIKRKGTLR